MAAVVVVSLIGDHDNKFDTYRKVGRGSEEAICGGRSDSGGGGGYIFRD